MKVVCHHEVVAEPKKDRPASSTKSVPYVIRQNKFPRLRAASPKAMTRRDVRAST